MRKDWKVYRMLKERAVMSKDNFDDWANFCGDKDFYDVDGDEHID